MGVKTPTARVIRSGYHHQDRATGRSRSFSAIRRTTPIVRFAAIPAAQPRPTNGRVRPDPGIRSLLTRHSAGPVTKWSRRCSLARTKRGGLSALLTFEGFNARMQAHCASGSF
jgi:hypothetical protein